MTGTVGGCSLGLGHRGRLVIFIVKLRVELEGIFIKLGQPFIGLGLLALGAGLFLGTTGPAGVRFIFLVIELDGPTPPSSKDPVLNARLAPATGQPAVGWWENGKRR